MKVLVYGSGVIGCYLAHVLCTAGHDVTLLARGQWKEQLQENGLRIRHHLQRKNTLDHPRVIGGIEEDDAYDAVFAVMPYNRMPAILEPLAAIRSPIVVLVGNNMSPATMKREILERSVCEKQVLFGFQPTAGKRDNEKGMLICERAGIGTMDIGCLHGEADDSTRSKLTDLFGKTGYKLHWQPDMEAYLICHLAAVLPICYLAYACNGDLTGSTGRQRRLMRMASREAYAIEYRISRCVYVEMFEAYCIRSLCKIFCMTDTTSYENLRRHVTFIRHSDLSDGDACHDEIIRRRKSQ